MDELAATYPDEVDGYRRYLAAARPAVELILAAADRAADRGRPDPARAAPPAGRRADGPALGPAQRGRRHARATSPTTPLVGPGAGVRADGVGHQPGDARHRARRAVVRRCATSAGSGGPIGGSGALTEALRRRGRARRRRGAHRRRGDGHPLRRPSGWSASTLADGSEIDAPIVVSACDPRRTFVEWLSIPPAGAGAMIERWRGAPARRRLRVEDRRVVDRRAAAARQRAPPVVDADDRPDGRRDGPRRGAAGRAGGSSSGPALLVNVPSIADPTMAPAGRHVLSLEVLLTPYRLAGRLAGLARAAAVAGAVRRVAASRASSSRSSTGGR